MKLLLIQAYLGRQEPPVFPLGLACLAAHLPGHELQGLDLNVASQPREDLSRVIKTLGPDAVLVSLRNVDTTWYGDPFYYFPHFQAQVRQIRALAPRTLIVLGGSGFSIFPREIMDRTPEIDLGLIGEAEGTINALLAQPRAPQAFPNVIYREGKTLRGGNRAALASMEDYLPPRYDLFPLAPYLDNSLGIGVETKRGCPLSCCYCTYPHLNGAYARLIPPARTVALLRELKRQGLRRFTFTDSVFNMPRGQAETLLKQLIDAKLGLQWEAYFHESQFDADFLNLSLEAGCDKFWFSPDGITPHALKALGKKQTAPEVRRTWRLITARRDLPANFSFFWQYPGMRWRDFLALMGFYLRHRLARHRRAVITFNQIRIEPGTPIQAQAIAEGLISAADSLLPSQPAEMMRMFYQRRPRGFFEWSYDTLLALKRRLSSI
jgi:anaerobic magnesium-protoporphyrin IX monomethyl ester cyclase